MTLEEISPEIFQRLLRLNADVKKQTGCQLIDFNLAYNLARVKAGDLDLAKPLPELREGVKEVVVDIFKNTYTEIMEDDENDENKKREEVEDAAKEESESGETSL